MVYAEFFPKLQRGTLLDSESMNRTPHTNQNTSQQGVLLVLYVKRAMVKCRATQFTLYY